MSNRVLIVCCGILLLLGVTVAGCGGMNHTLAPEQVATSSAAADPADLLTRDALEGEDAANDAHALLSATPISEPTTIRSPGNYRLVQDLNVSQGDGIVIEANNVRLWLGTHRLVGPGNKLGRAIVVDGAHNVRVTGGRVERFGLGVVLLNSKHCSVRGVDVRGGDETADPPNGNPPQIGVMLVNSAMNRVTRSHLTDVNLGLFIRGPGSYGNRIDRNQVVGGAHGLLAVCYNPAPGGDAAGPRHDRVRHNVLSRFGTGIVASAGSARNEFAFNTIRYFGSAYVDENGTNQFERNRTEQITP